MTEIRWQKRGLIHTPVASESPGRTDEGEAGGGQWKHTDGKARRTDQPIELKRGGLKPCWTVLD